MKSKIIFTIIFLLAVSGCQSIKKNNSLAVVVTPIDLPITPKEGEMTDDGLYNYLSLYDYLKNKNFSLKIVSNDPFIYEIPTQKGLLEELAKILKTVRTIIGVCTMNIANINTTKTEDGNPYRRKMVYFNKDYEVEKIIGVLTEFKKLYNPKHPDANKDGYYYLPNVNEIEEKNHIVNMECLEKEIIKIIEKTYQNCVVVGSPDYLKVFSSQPKSFSIETGNKGY